MPKGKRIQERDLGYEYLIAKLSLQGLPYEDSQAGSSQEHTEDEHEQQNIEAQGVRGNDSILELLEARGDRQGIQSKVFLSRKVGGEGGDVTFSSLTDYLKASFPLNGADADNWEKVSNSIRHFDHPHALDTSDAICRNGIESGFSQKYQTMFYLHRAKNASRRGNFEALYDYGTRAVSSARGYDNHVKGNFDLYHTYRELLRIHENMEWPPEWPAAMIEAAPAKDEWDANYFVALRFPEGNAKASQKLAFLSNNLPEDLPASDRDRACNGLLVAAKNHKVSQEERMKWLEDAWGKPRIATDGFTISQLGFALNFSSTDTENKKWIDRMTDHLIGPQQYYHAGRIVEAARDRNSERLQDLANAYINEDHRQKAERRRSARSSQDVSGPSNPSIEVPGSFATEVPLRHYPGGVEQKSQGASRGSRGDGQSDRNQPGRQGSWHRGYGSR